MPDAKPRTVAEIMSTPVVTAEPGETIATVAARMRERRVGSVVVVDDRTRGGDPHRTRSRAHRVRGCRPVARSGRRLDDPRARRGRSRRARRRRVRQPVGARLPPHPGGRRQAARRHRVDARPHADRADPTGGVTGARGAQGPRRCRRRRDRDRRRTGARGLLPLPPVLGGRPRREANARRRLVPPLRR